MTGQHDPGHGIERAVESTAAKFASRWLVPFLLAALGFFLRATLSDIQAGQSQQAEDIAAIKSDMRVLQTRLDERVIRQVEENTEAIDDLKTRVNRLEKDTSR